MNQVNIQTTYVQREQRKWREIIHEKFPEVTDIRKHCYYQTDTSCNKYTKAKYLPSESYSLIYDTLM